MHAKSDSEVTSIDASTPPRSPRRPLYYVQSPSQHDAEKMSFDSTPLGSPHHYHCSPIHHSRESSTSRFSASLRHPRHVHSSSWKKIHRDADTDDDEDGTDHRSSGNVARFYAVCFVFSFIVLFTLFSLILYGASKPYKPKIVVERIVFEKFNIQAGTDNTGVPTDMLSLNSTVKIHYRNSATFFGVHVSSTPLELYYYQLKVASGRMDKFYASRKKNNTIVVAVAGHQVPLYGGVSVLGGAKDHLENAAVPLNLTFRMRTRASVLGKLVRPKFYRSIRCALTLRGNKLGKPLNLTHSCVYQ